MIEQILARLNRPNQAYPVLAFVLALETARRFVTASSDGITKKVIRSMPFGNGMVINDEIWALSFMAVSADNNPEVKIRCVYAADGSYVGEEAWAKRLLSYGIVPEVKSPELTVASIGFSKRRQSWWGWSHRAMVEYHIGDRIFQAGYGDDMTPFNEHGEQPITTLAEARQSACNFADYVS